MKYNKVLLLIVFILSLIRTLAQDDPCDKGDDEGDQPQSKATTFGVQVVRPREPNEMIGPAGYDTVKKWVSVNAILGYKILFENDPIFATAPAQNVTIYMPIDPKLNPNSLRLGDFGFGSFVFTVPPNSTTYTNRLDVRDSLGIFVDVTAGLDIANRRAFWIFQSIDPATGLTNTLPPDVGLLPVDDTTLHNGEGFATFTLQPSSTVKTRDTVSTQSDNIFDTEEPVPTNIWTNTIDAFAPASKVKPIPAFSDTSFVVSWSGKDDSLGVGLKSYTLYVSENDGPFAPYKTDTDSTQTFFSGKNGSTYGFYTRATDFTGNTEAEKQQPDQTVTLTSTALRVQVKAWLQGVRKQAGGLMIDSLRVHNYLPSATPYPALGFTAVNNATIEKVNTGVFNKTGAQAITDWVWLELRSAANPVNVKSTRSAILRRDGMVVDMDGISPVFFNNVPVGKYYVAIRHRNHLGVMTAAAVNLNTSDTSFIDFTVPSTATYGTNAQFNKSGIQMLWGGDVNGDGFIRYRGTNNDREEILNRVGKTTPNNVLFGYERCDIQLDGITRYNGGYNDKNSILTAVGLTTSNNVIVEQLPK